MRGTLDGLCPENDGKRCVLAALTKEIHLQSHNCGMYAVASVSEYLELLSCLSPAGERACFGLFFVLVAPLFSCSTRCQVLPQFFGSIVVLCACAKSPEHWKDIVDHVNTQTTHLLVLFLKQTGCPSHNSYLLVTTCVSEVRMGEARNADCTITMAYADSVIRCDALLTRE